MCILLTNNGLCLYYSPSLNKLRLSTVAKVKLTPRIFRRSKKMNKKPPVPEKSPRIKSLPVVPPRKGAPPPKPLPYNVHRSEMVKKPDPAPRKVGRQGNGISAAVSSHQDTAGNPSNTGGKEPSHLPLFGGQVSKLSSPVVQSGGIGSRPRLNTPVVKPDPDAVPQNGVSTSPVPSARAGAAVPPPTKPRPPVPDNRKLNSAQNGCGRPPLPSPPKGAVGGSCEPVYSEAYGGGFEASKDPSESDLYSTVVDSPRVVRTPTSSQTPPTPLSRSLTPPVPLPRSAQAASPPTAPSPSAGEYSLTSHAAAEQKSRSSPGVPPPTPPDTYSMLARPDQPNKPLNSAPSEAVGKVYSSLKVEEIEQLKSAKHTYNMVRVPSMKCTYTTSLYIGILHVFSKYLLITKINILPTSVLKVKCPPFTVFCAWVCSYNMPRSLEPPTHSNPKLGQATMLLVLHFT